MAEPRWQRLTNSREFRRARQWAHRSRGASAGPRQRLLLDVRPRGPRGHCGATNIPIEELGSRVAELPRDRKIITYCRGQYCLFADEAAELLRSHGFEVVRLRRLVEWHPKAGRFRLRPKMTTGAPWRSMRRLPPDQDKYTEVAKTPEQGFHFHTGRPLALMLGYAEDDIDRLPAGAVESFAGTGNPFSMGTLRPGETVLDIGCGAGFDSFIAARQVGETGRVISIDMTEAMLSKAAAGAREAGIPNIEFRKAAESRCPGDQSMSSSAMG
jgi:rhodanese-related sulfurtransferase